MYPVKVYGGVRWIKIGSKRSWIGLKRPMWTCVLVVIDYHVSYKPEPQCALSLI